MSRALGVTFAEVPWGYVPSVSMQCSPVRQTTAVNSVRASCRPEASHVCLVGIREQYLEKRLEALRIDPVHSESCFLQCRLWVFPEALLFIQNLEFAGKGRMFSKPERD